MREEAEEMGADRSNERVRCLEGARDVSWQEVETTQDSVCRSRPPWGDFFPTSSQLLKASSACIQSFGVNTREEPCADAIVQHLAHISSSSFFLTIAP